MTTVFIADDHPLLLSGLANFIQADPRFTIVGTVTDGQEAIEAIVRLQPEIALIDLNMPHSNGLEVLSFVRTHAKGTRVVVLAAAATDAEIHSLVANGVRGLLFKEAAGEQLLECLNEVANDGHWFSPAVMDGLDRHERRVVVWEESLSALTPQERRIAGLAGTGCSNKQIAFLLHVSEGTVKVHLNSIFRKLGVSTRADLVRRAANMVDPSSLIAPMN